MFFPALDDSPIGAEEVVYCVLIVAICVGRLIFLVGGTGDLVVDDVDVDVVVDVDVDVVLDVDVPGVAV